MPIEESMPANLTVQELRDVYARLAPLYGFWGRWGDGPARRLAVELAAVLDGEKVLEIAVGPGHTLKLLAAGNRSGTTVGADLTGAMLRRTLGEFQRAAKQRPDLCQCDSRSLPFAEGVFDLVFASYLLDALSVPDIETALQEIRRVLKPSGRVLLLNMRSGHDWFDRLWRVLYWLVPNLLGGGRPIRLAASLPKAGFFAMQVREVREWGIPVELLLARRER